MFERKPKAPPRIGVTPLIDVVFILLIFVILMANFDRIRGLKVNLPKAHSTQEYHQKALIVSISETGVIQVQKHLIKPKDLLPKLTLLRKQHKHLLLRADNRAALKHAVRVLDYAALLRFSSVSIATKQKGDNTDPPLHRSK